MKEIEKQKRIQELEKEQVELMVRLTKNVKKKPAKRTSTAFNRAFEAVAIVIRASQIHREKLMIASQPSEVNFPSGGTHFQTGSELEIK